MKDRFVRIAVVLIAACQLYGVTKDAIQPAHAQSRVVDVNLVEIGGAPPSLALAIPVKMR